MKKIAFSLAALFLLSACNKLQEEKNPNQDTNVASSQIQEDQESDQSCLINPWYCGENYFPELQKEIRSWEGNSQFIGEVKKYVSKHLGLQFQYLNAFPGNNPISFTEKGNQIFMNDFPVITVYPHSKQDLRTELQENFMNEERNKNCQIDIQKIENREIGTIRIRDDVLQTEMERRKNEEKEAHEIEIAYELCGQTNGIEYFLTSDGWDKLFFLSIGQDWPVFAPASVEPVVP